MESLGDRLKSLGFKAAATVQPPQKNGLKPLEEIISAEVITNSQGSFLVRKEFFPYGYQHGSVVFTESFFSERINQAAKLQQSGVPLNSLLFLDTETSGLSGGSGSFAFLIGVGSFSDLGFNLQQFIIRNPAEEESMLLHFTNMIFPDSVFVTFNGKSFDIPLLQNRLIVNRLPGNVRNNPHIDVLHLSRKLWRGHLPSCSLKELEAEILKTERTDEEVPGWMIPEIYFEYLRTGDAEKLSSVVYHNAQDVVSLAALFIHISNLLEKNSELDEFEVNDLLSVGKIFLELNSIEIAKNVFLKCLEQSLLDDEKIVANNQLARIYKNHHQSQRAVQYWIEAANAGSYEACIELAMYYEHQLKDICSAIFWTEKARMIVEKITPGWSLQKMRADLEKRQKRLKLKEREQNV